MTTQWQGLCQNIGIWQGSFTQFSPEGLQLGDTPSEVTLHLTEDEKTIQFLLQRPGMQDIALQFNYPGPGPQVPFFATGCFSQGPLQHAPYTKFGAELAMIAADRRLRLVQLYDQGSDLSSLTLIRESRKDSGAVESPPLEAEALVGTWLGEAITLYGDYRLPTTGATQLTVVMEGDRLTQTLEFDAHTITSSAHRTGQILRFDEGLQPMQLLCLPGGASALGPTQIQPRTPFMLEAGWLVDPQHRMRLMRYYNERGEWVSTTLVTEHQS